MSNKQFSSELEQRISEIENPENQGDGFTNLDFALLTLTGIVGPVLLLIWGWN